MKRPLTKFSIAVAGAIVVLAGLHFSIHETNVAWATVLDRVRSVESYSYRIRALETTGPRPDGFEFATEKATTVYSSPVYGLIQEKSYNDLEQFAKYYWLRQTNEYVGVCYPLEEYERRPLAPDCWDHGPRDDDPRQLIMHVLEGEYETMGQDTLMGTPVEGVQMRNPNVFRHVLPKDVQDFSARIWIDTSTELPVWVEIGFTPSGSKLRTTIIQDQFKWDIPLNAALFEPNIPAGFTLDFHDKPRPPLPQGVSVDAFNQNTRAKPYLGAIDSLDLPDLSSPALLGVDTDVARPPMRYQEPNDIWMAQDACMAQWPPYEQVQVLLEQDLQDELGIRTLSVEELVTIGAALRERFWGLGGCLSEVSYPYAYGARSITALAYEKAPQDMDVIDHYVESLMTGSVLWTCPPDPHSPTKNTLYSGLLIELRQQQYEIIKQQAACGQIPTWKDLVRVADLTGLLSFSFRFDEALAVADWVAAQSETAGWGAYGHTIERMQIRFADSLKRAFPLFEDPHGNYPEEYRYCRRLWSFQGPRTRRERLEPRHFTPQAGK
ncbi:hypothetical protein ACFL6U_19065 [Planctomycetota bacterium]